MPPLALYLLKMILCSAILFAYYRFFLRNKLFHAYNRFYLLVSIGLSLTLPLLRFSGWQQSSTQDQGIIQMLQVVNSDQYMEALIGYNQSVPFNWEQIFLMLILSISFIIGFFFVRTLHSIYKLKRSSQSQWLAGIRLLHTQDKRTPFSFFNNIFWNKAIALDSENGQRILKHELAHVQEKHSHDKLFMQIILIFFWFNPIFWLLRKELHLIHEFIADKKAVEDGDTSSFAAMILAGAYPHTIFNIGNALFYSPIKRRIAMMRKIKNPRSEYFSRVLVLPLALLVIAAFSFKQKQSMIQTAVQEKITVVLNAGHGGQDNGATGVDGSFEKDLNLALVKKIRDLNKDKNINLILTRDGDQYQSPKDIAIFTKKANADLFISVHANTKNPALKKVLSGMEVIVSNDEYGNSTASKLFASALIGVFRQNYALPVTALPQQRKVGVWVLQEQHCPSVLIESGYISNSTDQAYLKSEAGQEVFAQNILKAIAQYAANRSNKNQLNRAAAKDSVYISPKVREARRMAAAKKAGIEKTPPAPPAVPEPPAAPAAPAYPTPPASPLPPPPPPPPAGSATRLAIQSADGSSILKADTTRIYIGENRELDPNLKPLYVLNGKIITPEAMKKISPDDIAAINVLKGTAAEAKYGKKAKDGAIEITSKATVIL